MHHNADAATLDPTAAQTRRDSRTLHLTVLSHWHPNLIGSWLELPRAGVELSRAEPNFAPHDVPLGDPYLSRRPVRITDAGPLGVCIDASGTSTPVQVDGVPVVDRSTVSPAQLADGVVIELADRVALLLHLRPPVTQDADDLGLLGQSAAMTEVRRRVRLVADLDVPVLIRGASGVGKELVAQAIHRLGRRAERPLVAVNMAAVPTALAGSTLFGHRKGAFSGATADHEGHFAAAHLSTLFLDEIGECPPEVQVLLLRALETGTIRAVGGREARAVDVRVIAATDADLETGVADGKFRGPLLHRLAGFVLPVAPLNTRREDLGILAARFAQIERAALGAVETPDPQRPVFPAGFIAALAQTDLPGNVRQLKNIVRQLVILQRDGQSTVEWQALIPSPVIAKPPTPAPEISQGGASAPVRYRSPEAVTEDELVAAMQANRYQAKAAAQALGISRTALYGLLAQTDRVRKATDLSVEDIQDAATRSADNPTAMAADLGVSRPALLRRMSALDLR